LLIWYIGAPDVKTLVLKVNSPTENMTVGNAELVGEGSPGYHAVTLAKAGIAALRPGVPYRWFIEVTFADGVQASVGSSIVYQPPSGQPGSSCQGDPVCAARELAGAGYWYDALALLAPQGQPPREGPAKELWKQLLSEVGLAALP
jgi:hypothetical protein